MTVLGRAIVFKLRRCSRCVAILTLTMLAGHIVDRTTGQPLAGVDISAHGPSTVPTARSNELGAFTLRIALPGQYTLTLSSDDVPPQTFNVVVHAAKRQHFDMTACSTTLDYSCAAVNQ